MTLWVFRDTKYLHIHSIFYVSDRMFANDMAEQTSMPSQQGTVKNPQKTR